MPSLQGASKGKVMEALGIFLDSVVRSRQGFVDLDIINY